MDIARQLNKTGHGLTKAEFGASLQRQGVQNIRWGPGMIPSLPWDSNADIFAKTSIIAGKTLAVIVADLHETGYAVDETDVMKSLTSQGLALAGHLARS